MENKTHSVEHWWTPSVTTNKIIL